MNKRLLIPALALILLAGLVSANTVYLNDDVVYKETFSKTYYNQYENSATTRTLYAYYDNDDRYSTYDYRHGYSYRTTQNYWERQHDYRDTPNVVVVHRNADNYYDYHYDHNWNNNWDWHYTSEPNRVQYRYVPYMNQYEYRECYDYTPRGKLFYISCD